MSEANSENTPQRTKEGTKKAYHHGNLRQVLLDDAVEMINEIGISKVSLRSLAKKAGVSHNAPYMHFKNRDALLAAIAQMGFQQLKVATEEGAFDAATSWREQLKQGCAAYVKFSVENPALFRVMFMEHDAERFPEYAEDSMQALKVLEDMIAVGQDLGEVEPGETALYTNFVWSMLHGVSVVNSGRAVAPLPYGNHDIEAMTRQFVEMLLAGIGSST